MMSERVATTRDPTIAAWTVSWSGIWIGAFTSVVSVAILGFIGTAIGAHAASNAGRVTNFNGVGIGALAFAILAAFLAFVIGGWISARIAGWRDAPTAALHGAITWVVGMFLILGLAAFGAAFMSGWFAGLAPAPIGAPAAPGQPVDPNAALAARNAALAAATAMLTGLAGGVIGGWIASDQPMTIRGAVPRIRIESERRVP